MWTVKRRQKLSDPDKPHFGFRVVERLNIANIAGLSVAMTVYLWGNRLLPAGVAPRDGWEIHVFFIAWALALLSSSFDAQQPCWRSCRCSAHSPPSKPGTTRWLRMAGWGALALAMGIDVWHQGWALGLVIYSGHTTRSAAIVYSALILHGRRNAG